MGFNQDFKQINEKYNILNVFLTWIGIKYENDVYQVQLEHYNEDYDDYTNKHHLFARVKYPPYLDAIYTFSVENFGVFEFPYDDNHELNTYDDYKKYIEDGHSALDDEANYTKFEINKYSHDNVKQEFIFDFFASGESRDIDIVNEAGFYVVVNYAQPKIDNPYYIDLLIRGNELMNQNLYDLAFLVLFSAIDNFITLKIEELQKKSYHNDIDLEKLEFGKKISLLVKTWSKMSVSDTSNEVRDLIMKDYKDIYALRNQVAHGKQQQIDMSNCYECWKLFVELYFIEMYQVGKLNDLITEIRKFAKQGHK